MENLICSKCEIEQPIDQFRRDCHNASGYNSLCHACNAKNQRAYRERNREDYNQKAKDYYKKNAERIQAQRKQRREAKKNGTYKPPTPASQKKASNDYYKRTGWKKVIESKWHKRGIKNMTYDRYDKLLQNQGFCCKICKKEHTDEKKLHVDHDHNTGDVRGLLCNNCNNGIGKIGDTTEALKRALKYLENHEKTFK